MQAEVATNVGSNGSLAAVGSATKMDVAAIIDHRNQEFIDNAKEQLKNLDQFTTEALEWIMMEHYQFSLRNTKFLASAAELTGSFDTEAVKKELIRNCGEENGHAPMYKAALKKIGVDIETRDEFPSTTHFLDTIGELVDGEPSAVLGMMFATETAAIFEHEVFLDISNEIIKRRNLADKGTDLVYFHEMHLSGVEQSHREELGVFLRGLPVDQPVANKEGDRPTIYTQQAITGAKQAIAAMTTWWADLLAELNARSSNPATA
ncbi:MAG: iron-containing redox enzyme family protein [Candidatus Parabeggiatoa sp.]|nr:iron-containing redox enzyme family protein [Candidatus Parabeggiatoa sp.]